MYRPFKDTLANGTRIVTVEAPQLHVAMLAVYVRAGSRHETPATNGVSHFLEHVFFRGCERFPIGRDMNIRVEDVGGSLNGVTTRDHGYYYTPLHPSGLAIGLETLGAMLSKPLLKEVEIEREVILEEMLDEVDDKGHDIDIDNIAKRVVYGDHPLALKIAGTRDTVKAMTREHLERHLAEFYVGRNLVVTVAGPVKRDEVLALSEAHFGGFPMGRATVEAPPPEWPRGPRFVEVHHDESQTEFRLSFPVPPESHPDFPALMVLRRVLDDGLSSRLQVNIVERRGLAYGVQAGFDTFSDGGSFDLDITCAHAKVPVAFEEALATLAALVAEGADEDELVRARVRHRMGLDFSMDSSADLAGWFGGTELFDVPETPEERAQKVDAVTRDDLVRVARQTFRADRLLVSAVGRLDKGARKSLAAQVDDPKGLAT